MTSFAEHPAAIDARWQRRFILLALALLAWRVIYLAVVPLDLVPDEAYYWDWSRQLDWGYYSKPPLVAWLIAASTALGGDRACVVRLPAAVLSVAALVAGYALAARMYSPRVAFWGAALAAASAGSAVLGLVMTIDAPLVAAWCAALGTFWRLLDDDVPRWPWMAGCALALALGVLAKQTMLAFFPLALLFLVVSPADRQRLAQPRLWLTAMAGLGLGLAPVIWWNAQHGWLTLTHTREHFGGDPVTLGKRLARAGEFLAGQLGVVSPVTAPLVVVVLAAAAGAFPRLDRRARFLWAFSGAPLAGVGLLSVMQRVQPNWPAPFYSAGLVLAAAWGLGELDLAPRLDRRRGAFRTALGVGLVTCGLVYLAPFVLSHPAWAGSRWDLTARLRGWSELGRQLGEQVAEVPRDDRDLFVIAATGRGPISELAFYTPGQPRVYAWRFGSEVLSQHDLWDGPADATGSAALLITPAGALPPAELAAAFGSVEPGATLAPARTSRPEQRLQVWRATGFRGWPLAKFGVPGPRGGELVARQAEPLSR